MSKKEEFLILVEKMITYTKENSVFEVSVGAEEYFEIMKASDLAAGKPKFTENGKKVLTISDNGLGIDLEKYKDSLFGMYKTFHKHPDSRGIGLFITKNQVEAMGGKIEVESKVGEGTAFKIYFNEKV